jgi:hypothetical protein
MTKTWRIRVAPHAAAAVRAGANVDGGRHFVLLRPMSQSPALPNGFTCYVDSAPRQRPGDGARVTWDEGLQPGTGIGH